MAFRHPSAYRHAEPRTLANDVEDLLERARSRAQARAYWRLLALGRGVLRRAEPQRGVKAQTLGRPLEAQEVEEPLGTERDDCLDAKLGPCSASADPRDVVSLPDMPA